MGLFDLFKPDTDDIVVKQGTSKGPGKPKVEITVGDIKQGKVVDANGYLFHADLWSKTQMSEAIAVLWDTSDVVLFLRASKTK